MPLSRQQSQQDRVSKLEDDLAQFIQVLTSNHKNIDASLRNLEAQID